MLQKQQKTIYTPWVIGPYRALTTSRTVGLWLAPAETNNSNRNNSNIRLTCVGIGCTALQLDGQGREQDDLDRGSRCIPKGTRHAVLVRHSGTLEQSGGPSPRRGNRSSNQPGLEGTAGSREHLRSLQLIIVPLQRPGDDHHDGAVGLWSAWRPDSDQERDLRKEESQADDEAIAPSYVQDSHGEWGRGPASRDSHGRSDVMNGWWGNAWKKISSQLRHTTST